MKTKNLFVIIIMGLLFMNTIAFAAISSVSIVQDPVFGTTNKVLLLTLGTLYSDSLTTGTVSETVSQLNALEPSSAQIQNPFTLSWKTDSEYTYYSTVFLQQINGINLVKSPSKTFGYTDAEIDVWIRDNCHDFDGDGFTEFQVFTSVLGYKANIACADNLQKLGEVYLINSPKPYWSASFTLNNGIESVNTQIVSSTGQAGLSKNIDGKVFIRFNGLGLFSYPTQVNQIYLYKPVIGNAVLFDSTKLQVVNNIYQNDASALVTDFYNIGTSEQFLEDTANSKINQLNTWTISTDFPKTAVTFEGALVKLTSKEKISFQNFVVYLNSNWIKITVPVGIPDIVSFKTDFTEMTATKSGTLTAQIKNIGTQIATFQAIFSCGKSNAFTSTQLMSNVGAGETRTQTFTINTPQLDTSIMDSCTVVVTDTTDTSKTDTSTVNFKIIPRPECTLDDEYATKEGGIWKVYKCDGTKFSILKFACTTGQIPIKDTKGLKYSGCVDESGGGVGSCMSDADCKSPNWLSTASCDRSVIQQMSGTPGKCVFTDQTSTYTIIGIVGIFLVIILAIIVVISMKGGGSSGMGLTPSVVR